MLHHMFNLILPCRSFRMRAVTLAFILLSSFAVPAFTEQPPLKEQVRTAVQNQMKDDAQLHLFSWKQRSNLEHGGTKTELLVNTPKGTVSRVVLINGKPLTPEQRKAEDERERKMLNPAQMRRKHQEEKQDDERTRTMLSTIPDAFDFTYLESSTAPNGHKLTRVKFTPSPSFNPPSRETAVFTGMDGEILLDDTVGRLVKVDGVLFKDVDFGWGILGRLYKGGRFFVEQSEITPSHWDTTKMILHFDGKELIFKSIHINEEETSWDFRPVPPMTGEQALNYLNHSESAQNARLAP